MRRPPLGSYVVLLDVQVQSGLLRSWDEYDPTDRTSSFSAVQNGCARVSDVTVNVVFTTHKATPAAEE